MPWAQAALFGKHVNIVGGCPFEELLPPWEAKCRPPIGERQMVVEREQDGEGQTELVAARAKLQVWHDVDEHDEYIVLADPGRGINDGRHDPDGLHVRSRRTRALVARLSEYLGPWGLGAAAVDVATLYRGAQLYVARGGGYGEAVLSAARVLGYRNIGPDLDASRIRQVSRLGGAETGESRIKAMNAVLAMLQRNETDMPSLDVVRCLKNCIVDGNGKIVARAGYHDEDLILLGHGERILDMLAKLSPLREPRPASSIDNFKRVMREAFGRDVIGSTRRSPLDDVPNWD